MTVDHVVGTTGRPQPAGGETVWFFSHLVCQFKVDTKPPACPGQEPGHSLPSLDILGLAILYVEHLAGTILILFCKKQG